MGKIWIPGGGGGADLDLVTASAADIRKGKVIVDQDGNPLTGTMAEKAAATYTPGTANQVISAGQYLTGAQTIKGDSNLVASKIKKGVSIFGIAGTFEGYVTSPLNLYNAGTWSNLQTTGYTVASGTVVAESSDIKFTVSDSKSTSLVRLNQTVDLTNYNYIKIYTDTKAYPNASGTMLFISERSTDTGIYTDTPASITSRLEEGYVILDISSITGFYYIYFGGYYVNGSGSYYRYISKLFLSTT